jgi:hypothetical protein
MIIKLYNHQPELRLKLAQPGKHGSLLASIDKLKLTIKAPAPPNNSLNSEIIRKGCWPGNPPENDHIGLHELPALIYPAFDVSDEGEIVFRFDKLLWKRPMGRYLGYVTLDSTTLAVLDIDLTPKDYIITGASVHSYPICEA